MMTDDRLKVLLNKIDTALENEIDSWGACRWCGVEEHGVDEYGDPINSEDAVEFRCDHNEDCPSLLLSCTVAYIQGVVQALVERFPTSEPPDDETVRRG